MKIKAQLGETITWMIAFVIIFFIVILFVIFSLILSTEKSIFYGKDNIILNKNNINLDSQNFLFDLLNDKMENGELVKEFIIKGNNDINIIEDALKVKVENKLQKLGSCNYLFSIEYNPENLKEYKEGKADLLYRKIDFGNALLTEKGSNELFAEGSTINLFSDEIRILIKFYLGECYEINE